MNQRCCARPDQGHTPTRRAERVVDGMNQRRVSGGRPTRSPLLLLHHPACERRLVRQAGPEAGSGVGHRPAHRWLDGFHKGASPLATDAVGPKHVHGTTSTMPLLFRAHRPRWRLGPPSTRREHAARIRDHVATSCTPSRGWRRTSEPPRHASIVNPDVDLTSIVTKVGQFCASTEVHPSPGMLSPT